MQYHEVANDSQITNDNYFGEENDIEQRDRAGIQSPRKKELTESKKGNNPQISLCLIIVIIVAIGIVECICVILFADPPIPETPYGNNTVTLSPNQLTSRVGGAWPHGSFAYHLRTCKNERYGCCLIYSKNHKYEINPNSIHKRDIQGSNCPSLKYLSDKYNEYYDDYYNPANCSEVKCCTIDYSRDQSKRENHTYTNLINPIHIVNNEVHNCPSIPRMIHLYENNYPSPNTGIYFLGIISIVLVILAKS